MLNERSFMADMERDATNRGAATRSRIVEAAYPLFVQQGYHGTSMRQIAREAGIALGGIYNHFDSKEAIFRAVIVEHHPFVTVLPQLETLADGPAQIVLRDAARLLVREMEKESGLVKLMFIELIELEGRQMPELVDRVLPHVLRFRERVRSQTPGSLRTQSPAAFFRSFMGTILAHYAMQEMLAHTAVQQMGTLSIDDLMDIYLHGLLVESNDA